MKNYAVIAFLFSSNLLAMENQLNICTKGAELRAVEIAYLTEDAIPCEVKYTRNRVTKSLWQAQHNAGFCETKATEFVNQLENSGWNCRSVLGEPKQ